MKFLKQLRDFFCGKRCGAREEFAVIERSFDNLPALSGGYTRIRGYERFGGNYKSTPVVPGVGPILDLRIKNGMTFAVRSDGTSDVCYAWITNNPKGGEWVKQ